MDFKNFRRWGLGISLAMGCLLSAQTAVMATQTLKIAFLGSEEDEDYDGSMVLKDYVESTSNGELAVEIYPNGRFCSNADECSEALLDGRLDIYITTNGGLAGWYPPAQFLDLPYLFPNDALAECAFDTKITSVLRKEVLENVGAARLMVISNTGGWRNIATTNKQIKNPKDVKGLKLRTIGAEIQIELVKALGGNPTPIAWPEVYTSLGTGVVEGTKNGITDIVNMKFQDHLNYLTLDGHAYMGALWWINEDTFQDLSDKHKRIVYHGFQELKWTTRQMPKRKSVEAYQKFREANGVIYALSQKEKEQFKNAAKPVWDWYRNNYGNTWINLAENAVKSCESKLQQDFEEATQ